mmetsp:Transcript_165603/g.526640  ORF Transcript_165603/g.526640 Transcript_165603/m.526640 type:complete len:235 (+) Transcript_165603:319-1023(+)
MGLNTDSAVAAAITSSVNVPHAWQETTRLSRATAGPAAPSPRRSRSSRKICCPRTGHLCDKLSSNLEASGVSRMSRQRNLRCGSSNTKKMASKPQPAHNSATSRGVPGKCWCTNRATAWASNNSFRGSTEGACRQISAPTWQRSSSESPLRPLSSKLSASPLASLFLEFFRQADTGSSCRGKTCVEQRRAEDATTAAAPAATAAATRPTRRMLRARMARESATAGKCWAGSRLG